MHNQLQKPTINQQVHFVFHHVYSPFIQPTFRCFLNSALFYSPLAGDAHTHTHNICWRRSAKFLLSTTKHSSCIHTVFLPAACCHQVSRGALSGVTASPCVAWCSRTPHPTRPISPTPRCCMSVSQCNLRFHVRVGSNDHNNNGNNNYNNNLLSCVCTVPGWCSVQFSLSLEGRERG